MDPTLGAVLGVCVRWIHIASVVALIGGFIYARFVLAPAVASLPSSEQEAFAKNAANRFRPLLITVIVTVLGSGMYNYAMKATYPRGYHMWMGIKLLLVLHICASAILYTLRPGNAAKSNRNAISVVISGLIVIAIADYLRYLSLK